MFRKLVLTLFALGVVLISWNLLPKKENPPQAPSVPDASSPSPSTPEPANNPDTPYPSRVYYRNGVVILMYHHIDEQESSTSTIMPRKFISHLDMLKEKGYNVVSLEDTVEFLEGKKAIPPNAVAITFDDGYESFYRYAFPELARRKMAATNFVIVGMIGDKNAPLPPRLNWDQIKEMQPRGMTFYSHTYNSHTYLPLDAEGKRSRPALVAHQYLSQKGRQENEEEYRSRVLEDLTKARLTLSSKLGYPVPFLSLPYGWGNRGVETIIKEAGYRYAFTIKPGFVTTRTPPLALNRLNAGNPKITADALHKSILEVAAGKIPEKPARTR